MFSIHFKYKSSLVFIIILIELEMQKAAFFTFGYFNVGFG